MLLQDRSPPLHYQTLSNWSRVHQSWYHDSAQYNERCWNRQNHKNFRTSGKNKLCPISLDLSPSMFNFLCPVSYAVCPTSPAPRSCSCSVCLSYFLCPILSDIFCLSYVLDSMTSVLHVPHELFYVPVPYVLCPVPFCMCPMWYTLYFISHGLFFMP